MLAEILQDEEKTNKFCEEVFTSMDVDDSGFIEINELIVYMNDMAEQLNLP